MIMLIFFILAIISGSVIFLLKSRQINRILTAFIVLCQIFVTIYAYLHMNETDSGFFNFDSLGVLLSIILSILLLTTLYHNYQYFRMNPCSLRNESIFFMSLVFLTASINGAYYANHLGILWACVEATTLSVAALIYHERTDSSLEATWKYIFVCSIGITIAFTGILFITMAANEQNLTELNINQLIAIASEMDTFWVKVGFLLIMTGYTAKLGLFPLHAAAIDAKTVAPFHINALISTSLVNVGFTGLFRAYSIIAGTDAFLWAQKILLLAGIISIVIAAFHILKVKHFKRMFAFSTLEHMGIIALALSCGGIGFYAALLHLVLHSFAKATVFYQIGQVNAVYNSYLIEDTGDYFKFNPTGAIVMILSLVTVTAMPPSGLFITEFMIFKALFFSGHYLVAIIALILLTVIMFVFCRNFFHLLFNKTDHERGREYMVRKRDTISQFAFLALILYIGFNPPAFLNNLINEIIKVLG